MLSRLGAVVLAALLLVPLVLRAHHHASHDPAARSCAACVVAQHTPAVHTPPAGLDAPALRTFSVPLATACVVARLGASPARGRAPPLDPSRAA